MTHKQALWISYCSVASTLVPLVCLIIYRKGQPRQNLILAVSLALSLIFDLIGIASARIYKTSVLSNNLYFIVAFPAIMWFYHETLVKPILKITIRVFTILFLVLALISALDQGLNVLNYNTMTLSSILITITSFFFVADLNLMNAEDFAKNPFHKTNIILNTSLTIYYLATIIIFALSDYIYSNLSTEDTRFVWVSHNGTHVLKNVGIAIAFYLSAKRGVGEIQLPKSQRQIR